MTAVCTRLDVLCVSVSVGGARGVRQVLSSSSPVCMPSTLPPRPAIFQFRSFSVADRVDDAAAGEFVLESDRMKFQFSSAREAHEQNESNKLYSYPRVGRKKGSENLA